MKILKKIALFTFIGVVFATCKKETLSPSSTVGQPVFSFNGTIGGASLNMQAGVSNYYMQTTYSQSGSGVYSFIGTLQNTVTPNSNSIQIIINDDKVTPANASSDISNSVIPAAYVYNIPGGNSIGDSVTIRPFVYAGSPSTYTYTFGDGSTAVRYDASPITHSYNISKNYYITSLSVASNNGNPIISKLLNLKKTSKLSVDSISMRDSSYPYTTVTLTAHISGASGSYGYVWWFGDGSSTASASPSITHIYATPDHIYTYTCAVGEYPSLDSASLTSTLLDSLPSNRCRINFHYDSITAAPNPLSLSNVTVNYTDPNGIQYTSNNSQQPGSSTFQVTSVSNYQKNTNNQQTKMLTVTFNCMLYPLSGGTPISATNCTATIAVAYQ